MNAPACNFANHPAPTGVWAPHFVGAWGSTLLEAALRCGN